MKQIEQQNKRVSPSPQKGAITERGLFRLMLPSLLGILLCSTCLAGLTWAYFSDSVTSSANTITAATFTVEVTITEITDGSSPTDPAGAGIAVPAKNGNSGNKAGGQEEPPSGTSSVTAPNTAANAEGKTLTTNVSSVETKDLSTDPPTNEEGGTDTRTVTQQDGTTTGKDSTSKEGTPEGGSESENKAAGKGSTTGKGSTSAADTSGAGPVSQIEAAGEGSTTGKDSTSAADTSGAGPVSQIEAAGKGSTTGEGSNSAAGTPEGGSVSQDEAAGEVTFAAANSSKMGSETDTTVNRNEDGSYSLTAGKKYTVKLTASGTATGYCKVTVNETVYYTETMDPAMNPAQELVFSIDCSRMTSETTVTITPGWVNSDYQNIESEEATNKIISDEITVTQKTGANTAEQSPSATEAKMDESPSEVTFRLNKQITAEQTRGEETTTADESTDTTSEEQPEKQSEEQSEKQSEKQQEEQPEEQSEKQSEE